MLLGYNNNLELDVLKEKLDVSIDNYLAKLSLEGESCALNHGPGVKLNGESKAVNLICQNFGEPSSGTVMDQVRIPICENCEKGLTNGKWVLLYCITCNSSQWILKEKAKLKYNDDVGIIWLDECPICVKKQEELEE